MSQTKHKNKQICVQIYKNSIEENLEYTVQMYF